MKLLPLEMIMPSVKCVYAQSKLRQPVEVEKSTFEDDYTSGMINVSLHPDGLSDSQKMMVYSKRCDPMAGWFIVE